MRRQRGIALAELLVAAAIAALVMTALAGVLGSVRQADTQFSERTLLQRDARLALERIAMMVEGSRSLLAPLEVTTTSRNVLAVSLPPTLDRNGDGYADADNNKNGSIDDDISTDYTNDGAPGIKGIDDDGDGTIDNGSTSDNDENGSIATPVGAGTGTSTYRFATCWWRSKPAASPFSSHASPARIRLHRSPGGRCAAGRRPHPRPRSPHQRHPQRPRRRPRRRPVDGCFQQAE